MDIGLYFKNGHPVPLLVEEEHKLNTDNVILPFQEVRIA